ncbi:MAG: hypothetical protein RSG96_02860, partial [Clostridia bacterium]
VGLIILLSASQSKATSLPLVEFHFTNPRACAMISVNSHDGDGCGKVCGKASLEAVGAKPEARRQITSELSAHGLRRKAGRVLP